jgi:predicted AAA+ superfamily ATPase
MYKRKLSLALSNQETCFLWGPRQTGKSTLLKQLFPGAKTYDLLLSGEYQRLLRNPGILREECQADETLRKRNAPSVIIDEVQKIPALLDEVHWLIENLGIRFVLCGSSARKVKRGQANLLGGRAVRYELHPLVYPEVADFSLPDALNRGLLPRHYLSPHSHRLMESYVGDYLREEIAAEALTRNIPAFGRFLEVAAMTNGELVNYVNIASECGVSAPSVKEYFQILEDTLIGKMLPAYRKRAKRRIIAAPKFYFFDLGIVTHLTRRGKVLRGSELFGKAFEHFIWMELSAHSRYTEKNYPISYWKTSSGIEVDFILGDHEVAIEVKSSSMVTDRQLKGLRAFREDYQARRMIVISMDPKPRKTSDGIDILPWEEFLRRLWSNKII